MGGTQHFSNKGFHGANMAAADPGGARGAEGAALAGVAAPSLPCLRALALARLGKQHIDALAHLLGLFGQLVRRHEHLFGGIARFAG